MRRTWPLPAAALCAAALLAGGPARAAERAAVVPAVPAAMAAPSVSAPRIAMPALNGLPSTPGLSLSAGLPALSLPSAAAAATAGAAPAPGAATAGAAPASMADFRSGAEISGQHVPSAPALKEISATGGNLRAQAARPSASGSSARAGSVAGLASRLGHDFDGSAVRAGSVDAPSAVQGRESRWTARLARSSRSFAKKAGLAAAATLMLAAPALAQASTGAGAAGPIMTQSVSLAWLSAVQPIAAAAGAVIGAIYGLIVARGKGEDVNGGDALASALRYGVIGGASVYMLLDITHVAFIGPSVGLKPLSAAVATAALGRAAFQGKFSDAATTSADRIVAAFPAVAAALGLSITVNLIAPPLSLAVATTAMAVTGVASAIYAAVYKPGRSPAAGPAMMSKGYVLQALMCGMALALSTPWQAWIFAAMGAAGFGLVLWTFGRELWSLIPRGASQPPAPPAPPATPKA